MSSLEQKPYTLLLTSLECLHSSSETGHDDVYIKIYVDGSYQGVHYKSNPLKMKENDSDDARRYLDIAIQVSANSTVTVDLWDNDTGANDDDQLGTITINRNDPIQGSKTAYQTTGDKKARYKVSWRVIYKPIPTLRIHGLYCQKESTPSSPAAVDAILAIASEASSKASEIIGKVKTPRAKLLSKGFKGASYVLDGIGEISDWLANALEGADDIYLQHISAENPDGQQGGFCPPAGSSESNFKMRTGREISFYEEYGQYFRFPLDQGDVTIQIRDKDVNRDDCFGSVTIKPEDYQALLSKGAQVAVCTQPVEDKAAIYHLCYSVAEEDWAKPATIEGQGFQEDLTQA